MSSSAIASRITVRQLREDDLPSADRIFRLAFGTFLGLPDPLQFFGDADYVRTRWRANPQTAFAAEYKSELAGSNFAALWGSFGFFGPLTIKPDFWDQGLGKRLLEPVMDLFEQSRTVHTGLFTFAQSPKHVHLYQKYGFWPRFLTAIMSKPVKQPEKHRQAVRYSELSDDQRAEATAACRELTDSIFDGLDVTAELTSVKTQGLGETVLLYDHSRLDGFAICHCGPGTEAGGGACYIKFGAVPSGSRAGTQFEQLLDACEMLAIERGLQRLVAGMNFARREAFQILDARGFRTDFQGVAMERPNGPGYNRPGVYVIDDWR
ncbi:MAG: GNAT family N-acetyltransferase [Planctomycetes bacterium]|nr:GNAT family N-acetyltransferase [Planctomycetota bacterium]